MSNSQVAVAIGVEGEVALTPFPIDVAVGNILTEAGGNILTEDGGLILLG